MRTARVYLAAATLASLLALLAGAPHAAAAALPAGALAPLAGAPCIASGLAGCAVATGLTEPAGVAVSPDGRNVYVVSPSKNSVAALARGAGGRLVPLKTHGCVVDVDVGGAPCPDQAAGLGGASAVAVSPDGRDVYVASTGSGGGAVAAFARGADGSLTPIGCLTETGGTNCGGAADTAPGLTFASALAVSPDGRDVYVAGTSSDAIAELARHPDGSLTPLPSHACIEDTARSSCPDKATALQSPVALAVSPDGANVYASTGAAVVELRRAGASGGLEQVPGHPCAGTAVGCAPAPGIGAVLGMAAGVVVSPDGRDVYVAGWFGGTYGAIAELSRSAAGALASLPGHACIMDTHAGASCPDIAQVLGAGSNLAVSADGASIYAAGTIGSGVVAELARDPASGALRVHAASACLMDAAASLGCPEKALGLGGWATQIALAPGGANAYASGLTVNGAVVELDPGTAPVCAAATAHGGPVAVPLPCLDLNGDPLTRKIVAGPAHGTLGAIDQAHGRVVYTPAPGFSGTDSFSFAASDGASSSKPAKATVVVPAKPPWGGGGGGPPGGGGGGNPPGGGGGGNPPSGHRKRVRLSHLRISPRRFHVRRRHGRHGSSQDRHGHHGRRVGHSSGGHGHRHHGRRRGGARVRFHLSAAARVRFTILRSRPGRRSHGRCVARRGRHRHRGRRCTRHVRVAAFTRHERAGNRGLRFGGRPHGHALPHGAYRLRAVPRAAGRAGRGDTARFAVVARRHRSRRHPRR